LDHHTDEGTENAVATLVEAWLQACGGFTYIPYLRAMHGKEETSIQASRAVYFATT